MVTDSGAKCAARRSRNQTGARTFLSAATPECSKASGISHASLPPDLAESEQHKSGPLCGLDRNVRAPARLENFSASIFLPCQSLVAAPPRRGSAVCFRLPAGRGFAGLRSLRLDQRLGGAAGGTQCLRDCSASPPAPAAERRRCGATQGTDRDGALGEGLMGGIESERGKLPQAPGGPAAAGRELEPQLCVSHARRALEPGPENRPLAMGAYLSGGESCFAWRPVEGRARF
jgi:hypothetical protein